MATYKECVKQLNQKIGELPNFRKTIELDSPSLNLYPVLGTLQNVVKKFGAKDISTKTYQTAAKLAFKPNTPDAYSTQPIKSLTSEITDNKQLIAVLSVGFFPERYDLYTEIDKPELALTFENSGDETYPRFFEISKWHVALDQIFKIHR